MRIGAVHIYRYSLPLVRPVQLKKRLMRTRTGLLIRILGRDGSEGWGEAAPLPHFSGESLRATLESAVQLPHAVEGRDAPRQLALMTDCIHRWLAPFAGPPSLMFGIETAVLRALAASYGVTLRGLLSSSPRDRVYVNGLLAGPLEQVVEAARALRTQGYRAAKLKVGRQSISDDVEAVRAVSRTLGEDVALRLDANRAWTWEDACSFAKGVGDCRIEYIEEPLADPSHLIEFAGRTGLPVALDETVAEAGERCLELWRGAKAVVLKPTILGGIEVTCWLARRALNMGAMAVLSSSFESGVGLSALAELAAATYASEIPVGLDTAGYSMNDLIAEALPIAGGALALDSMRSGSPTVWTKRIREVAYG